MPDQALTIYTFLSSYPDAIKDIAQPSFTRIGFCLGNLFDYCIGNKLHFLNERQKLRYAKRLIDFDKQLNEYRVEEQCEAIGQIALPLLDRLAYYDDDLLVEALQTLLLRTSLLKEVDKIHPGLISILDSLCSDELKILDFLNNKLFSHLTLIKKSECDDYDFNHRIKYFTDIKNHVNFLHPEYEKEYFQNLIRLGLVESIKDGACPAQRVQMSALIRKCLKEHAFLNMTELDTDTYTPRLGTYMLTDLGKLFVNAAVLRLDTKK